MLVKLGESVPDFETKTVGSAGYDLYCLKDVLVAPNERVLINTGVALGKMPLNLAGFVFMRSGVAHDLGLRLSNGVGVIDPDYRDEIKISLHNTSKKLIKLVGNTRIVQLVFMPVFHPMLEKTDSLDKTSRKGGFGSTNKY